MWTVPFRQYYLQERKCLPLVRESSCLYRASTVSKHFFINPTDAHNYKITGMLKTIKVPIIAPNNKKVFWRVREVKVNVHWWASRIFKITSTMLILRTRGAWHRIVWYSSTNFSDERAAWSTRNPITGFCSSNICRVLPDIFALSLCLWFLTYKQNCHLNVQVCTICIWSTVVPNFTCHGTVVRLSPSWDRRLKKSFTRPLISAETFPSCVSILRGARWHSG